MATNVLSRQRVYALIDGERAYQETSMRKVAALAVAAMENCGAFPRATTS